MPQVNSKLQSAVQYSAGPAGKVVIRPGANTITDAQLAGLKGNTAWERHIQFKHVSVGAAGPSATVRGPSAVVSAEGASGATGATGNGKPGKGKTAAEQAKEASADADKAFLAAYDEMNAADQKALYTTLTAEQKAMVDAHEKAKAG